MAKIRKVLRPLGVAWLALMCASTVTTVSAAARAAVPQIDAYTPVQPGQRLLTIHSEPGDPIGGGQDWALTALFRFPEIDDHRIRVIAGFDNWTLDLLGPRFAKLDVGTYAVPVGSRWPQISLSGRSQGCTSSGSFTILAYDREANGSLAYLHVTFATRCKGATGGATGELIIDNRPGDRQPLQISPSALDFATTVWPATATAQTVTVTNPNASAIAVGVVRVTSSAYVVQADRCSNTSLAAGASCTLEVTFRSRYEGPHPARLTLPNGAGFGVPHVALAGQMTFGSAWVPRRMMILTSDPWGYAAEAGGRKVITAEDDPDIYASFRYGTDLQVSVDEPGTPDRWDLTVRPADGDPLVPAAYRGMFGSSSNRTVTGVAMLSPVSSQCMGGDVVVGALDRFPNGSVSSAHVTFDLECSSTTTRLVGEVVIDMAPLDGRRLDTGTRVVDFLHTPYPAGQTRSIIVTNPSSGAVTIGEAAVSPAEFRLGPDGCSGQTLAAGASCSITVTYLDGYQRRRAGALTLPNDGDAGRLTVGLWGEMDFGDVKLPSSTVRIIGEPLPPGLRSERVFTDGLDARITASSNSRWTFVSVKPFTASDRSITIGAAYGETLAPGIMRHLDEFRIGGADPGITTSISSSCSNDSTVVVLQLDRRDDGSLRRFRARYDLHCADGAFVRGEVDYDNRSITELDQGLTVAPTALDFPSTPYPQGAVAKPVVVTNTAATVMHIGDLAMTNPEFEITTDGCSGRALAPAASCQVGVRFLSALPNARPGMLVIPAEGRLGWAAVALRGKMDPAGLPIPRAPTFTVWLNEDDQPGHVPTRRFNAQNAQFNVSADRFTFSATMTSLDRAHTWSIVLGAPSGEQLQRRRYEADELPTTGARISVMGDGLTCGMGFGEFTIRELELADNGSPQFLRASFDFFCFGRLDARGEIVIDTRLDHQKPIPLVTSADAVAFGDVALSQMPATRTLVMTNPGPDPVQMDDVELSDGPFSIAADTCSGAVVAAHASCSVSLGFVTLAAGPQYASLHLPNSRQMLEFEVTATAVFADLGLYHAVRPAVAFDSAKGTGRPTRQRAKVKKNVAEEASLAGVAGLPATGMEAVLALVTVTGAAKAGTLTFTLPSAVLPSGASTSGRSITFASGGTVTSLVLIPVSAVGRYRVVADVDANVLVEVVGYLGDGSAHGGLKTVPMNPRRLVDTAKGLGWGPGVKQGKISRATVARLVVPSGLVTITTSSASSSATLKVWPVGESEPVGGGIPVPTGEARSTTLPIIAGTGGAVNVRLSAGSAAVAIDLVAAFEAGDEASWDGRTVFVNPAPMRGFAVPGSRVSGPVAYDGFGPELGVADGDVTLAYEAVGVWGALSTDTTKPAGGVRLAAPALSQGGPGGISHTTRAKKAASNLTIWPMGSDGRAMITVEGGSSSFAFDEVAYIVSDFAGIVPGGAPGTVVGDGPRPVVPSMLRAALVPLAVKRAM